MYKNYFSGLTKNTFLLALASLFADISTEMLYPVLPVYLTHFLKVSGSSLGVIEGVATATQNIVQGASGWLADKLQKRKLLAVIGYTLSAIAKPLIGVAGSETGVLGARFLDRLGSGTRSAPRDALVAGSAGENLRGKAFGLEGVGDNLGAFLGPLLAIFLLFTLQIDIRSIFFLGLIPGLLAVGMVLLVKELPAGTRAAVKPDVNLRKFPKVYWKYLLATAVFGLGNIGGAFLILRTREAGITLAGTILIYAVFNLTAALVSYPAGFLSDKFKRKNVLLTAFFTLVITYLGFGFGKNMFLTAGLFMLYGVFQGIFRSVGKAYASDFVLPQLRASGIGWYSATVGMSGLVASIVAGQLWDKAGHPAVFIYGSILATAGSLALLFLVPSVNRLNSAPSTGE